MAGQPLSPIVENSGIRLGTAAFMRVRVALFLGGFSTFLMVYAVAAGILALLMAMGFWRLLPPSRHFQPRQNGEGAGLGLIFMGLLFRLQPPWNLFRHFVERRRLECHCRVSFRMPAVVSGSSHPPAAGGAGMRVGGGGGLGGPTQKIFHRMCEECYGRPTASVV